MILLSSLLFIILLIFPSLSGCAKKASSRNHATSLSASTTSKSRTDSTERQPEPRHRKPPPEHRPSSHKSPVPKPTVPPAVIPVVPSPAKTSETPKKVEIPVKTPKTAAPSAKGKPAGTPKAKSSPTPPIPEHLEKKKMITAKKSEYIRAPQKEEEVKLDLTQPETLKSAANSAKETTARKRRNRLKEGEVNDHSDDTFDEVPAIPKTDGKSFTEPSAERVPPKKPSP
ncbi:unnamed protein product [Caenorhabditis sp. 36 PRJEB53466]|nr:unnamed protein product [Caenorhabditis sp. 36 PRJEB53466]